MSYVGALLLVVAVAMASPQGDKSEANLKKWKEQCEKESGFDTSSSFNINEPSKTLMCYVACRLEQEGTMKADGSLDADLLKNSTIGDIFSVKGLDETLAKALEGCTKDVKIAADKCDTVGNLMTCVRGNIKP